MKISITEPADFAASVALAAAHLSTRGHLILGYLKLTAEGDHLQITSFDYEIATRVDVGAQVDDPGSVLVPGRLLADLVRTLPKNHELTAHLDGDRLHLACGRATFTLPTGTLKDYPSLPKLTADTGTVDAELFADAVAQLAPATENDPSAPFLSAIAIRPEPDHLVMWATDRYRLAVRRLPWTPTKKLPELEHPLLVPAKELASITKGLADRTDGPVHLHLPTGKSQILGLVGGGLQLTVGLLGAEGIDGPKLLASAAEKTTARFRFVTASLAEASKRAGLVLPNRDRGAKHITISFDHDTATITAGGGDDASALDTIDAALIEGEPRIVHIAPHMLIDAAKAIGTSELELALTGPPGENKPVIATQAAADEDALRYLLMPIRPSGASS